MSRQREFWMAEGFCRECGGDKGARTQNLCLRCVEQARKRRAERKVGKGTAERARVSNAEAQKRYRGRIRAEGKCVDCGRVSRFYRCRPCREDRNTRRTELRDLQQAQRRTVVLRLEWMSLED